MTNATNLKSIEALYDAHDEAQGDVMGYANSLQCSLFATRESTEEAYSDVFRAVEMLPKEHKATMTAAVQILINTIAEEVKRKAEWR
jgi:hypothetical protein